MANSWLALISAGHCVAGYHLTTVGPLSCCEKIVMSIGKYFLAHARQQESTVGPRPDANCEARQYSSTTVHVETRTC
jgi:hypothetical protein